MSLKLPYSKLFWFLSLSIFLVSCTPELLAPEGTEAVSVEPTVVPTGETQNLYFPVFQNKDSPFPMPGDPPLSEWRTAVGWVPIMPGAQAGEEMDGKYVFTTFARIPNVEAYYLEELSARGWEPLSIAESPNKTVLLLQQGETRVTITMDFLEEQELCYVVIEG